jgi:hypothetical protein
LRKEEAAAAATVGHDVAASQIASQPLSLSRLSGRRQHESREFETTKQNAEWLP